MKQRIIDFVKAHWLVLLAIVGAFILYISFSVGQSEKTKLAADIAALKAKNEMIQTNRDSLSKELVILKKKNTDITHEKDSISVVKDKQSLQLAILIRKHKQEIDSLTNPSVSNDSVFARLQPIYPNLDSEPLVYPFSGTQVRQIYGVAISYPRIQKEYTLQTMVLQTTNNLISVYRNSEKNYQDQIKNLTKNIDACSEQINNKDQQLKDTNKQLNRKTFWNWTYKAAAVALAAFAIFK
jgi:septal ring factor EnvC (AmiA/AmiB activator)